jgi:hypothetical protein
VIKFYTVVGMMNISDNRKFTRGWNVVCWGQVLRAGPILADGALLILFLLPVNRKSHLNQFFGWIIGRSVLSL